MDAEKIMKAMYDVFDPSLPQLAPGNDAGTRRALELLYGPGLAGAPADMRILDLGCGNGAQTLRLATELGGRVTAVDNHRPFLDELERRAAARGLADRIETRCADMTALEPGDEIFDLVWAEGSAYVMGIPEALRAWRAFLKPGGAVGFTELTWLEEGAPKECREFFASEYPRMADVASHLATVEACGYDLVGRFTLPESAWWGPYYDPLTERLDGYEPPDDSEETRAVLAMVRREIEMYRRYSRWYGYVFLLLRVRG
jgi:ubiquinone/menaquinone biosynthesis C-methylase UbiE